MADGPNHEMNFYRGILNAEHNLDHITAYLRFNKNSERYKDYLEMYIEKLEGTDVYDEFKSDLDDLNETVEKEANGPGIDDTPSTEPEEMTEEKFRSLSAEEQRELVRKKLEGQPRTDGDDSNADKRVTLYFS